MKNIIILKDAELSMLNGGAQNLTEVFDLPTSIYSTITSDTTGVPGQAGFLGAFEAGNGNGIGDVVGFQAVTDSVLYTCTVKLILKTAADMSKCASCNKKKR